MKLSNKQPDKNEFSLLPPTPSYKDDDSSQQYEIERNQQNKANNHTTILTSHRSSRIRNSATILPDIIISSPQISSPPETTAAVEKRASRVAGKSKFVSAWILDQHERTLIKKMPSSDSYEDNNQGLVQI
jgi:hypothetical protein